MKVVKTQGTFILQGCHKERRKPQDLLLPLAFAFSMFIRLDLGKPLIKSVFFVIFSGILKILCAFEMTKSFSKGFN